MQIKKRKAPLIGIIVLHWNGFADTQNCLTSIEKLNYQEKKIYVIDNHSTNDSLAKLKKNFPNLAYLELSQNLGYAGGMNVGIKTAQRDRARAVLILNNDTLLKKNCLNLLVNRLFKNKKTGAVVPMVYLGKSGKIIGSLGGKINWSNGEARQIDHLKKDRGGYRSKKTEFAPGSAFLVKSRAIKKAGLIPENYFLYNEDVDWSLRLRRASFKILTEPRAKVWHNESASSGNESPLKTYYYVRNILIFMNKFAQGKRWLRFLIGFHWKLLKMKIKYLCRGKLSLIVAMLNGYFDFLRGIEGKSEKYDPKPKI